MIFKIALIINIHKSLSVLVNFNRINPFISWA